MNHGWRKAVRDTALDTTAKAVAYTLGTYADRNGICWPSLATIARGAGLAGNHPVVQALRRLESAGLLRISRSRRSRTSAGERTSERNSNTYLLCLPDSSPAEQSRTGLTVRQPNSDKSATEQSTGRSANGDCSAADLEAGSRTGPEKQTSEPLLLPSNTEEEAGQFTRIAIERGLLLREMP